MNVDTGKIIEVPDKLSAEELHELKRKRFVPLTKDEERALRSMTPAERIAYPIRKKMLERLERG